ncbi:3-oxoacyl-ACP synthase [Arenibacter latericius]|uniref:3-oxoacyl-ACP synthase n=1 Tax=Arenibacter latericius TaxID=86104 RepID=UPI0003FD3B5A|nr:3-oxoacyl-ACP synthase [Arenibacter latericius]MDX1363633.1 3-oxoacyl-ACP synthase [Arenibacter latericius]
MNITPKEQLYSSCKTYIEERLLRIQGGITSLEEALTSETKSSAGDKHETGRAMIQLEREKLGKQLAEVQLLQERFKKVPLQRKSNQVILGSVVYTSKHHYYIGISAGKILVDGEIYYAIAPDTPMGKILMGKSIGEKIFFNGSEFKIKEIE